MILTQEQKQEFYDRGILKLPGVVSQELVLKARRAINAYIGQNGIDPSELNKYRSQSYCPGLGGDPVITDLYNASPLKSIAESLIGEGSVKPVGGGQIALRFPSGDDTPRDPKPHIDGMYTPTNGVKEGTIANFTALVGVFLSDLPEPFAGNFTAWPGSHRTYEAYFREKGPEALLSGLPPVELGEPEQFTGSAGDAALCHYQLGHGIASNVSSNIRYAIFFRLLHVDHEQYHWECMTDIWKEWSGLQEFR
ncbi:MAG: hypothetical protein V4671_23280 [Armatimonadota bacterium]